MLDTNAAGFPADPTAGGPNGLSLTQIGQKNSLALADLTVLLVVKTPGSAGDYLQQQQINNFAGLAQLREREAHGILGVQKREFRCGDGRQLVEKLRGRRNSSGYLKTFWHVLGSPARTDQAVLSRQQLIDLWRALDGQLNALQYLGTFSRALNQPSYFPTQSVDSNKPGYVQGAPEAFGGG